ncbi:uncharacterized protein KIAA0930-like isoform X2 [Watersipora subatra]|uniref:uncharacterized protein KIAA0930-like isoform X2 n=1 Tax=Watersipora subatra TaxID=2589382 RepID=UPI00355AE41C
MMNTEQPQDLNYVSGRQHNLPNGQLRQSGLPTHDDTLLATNQRKYTRSSSIQRMLETIIVERNKGKQDEDYVLVHCSAEAFWTSIFSKYFLSQSVHETESDSRDDLLFFVRNCNTAVQTRYGSSSNLYDQQKDVVQVFRKDSKNLPSLGDLGYNWEETVYLNLILQQFEYSLTCAVCSRTGDQELQILKKSTQKVYASPSQRSMESKGTGESLAYPNIYFTVDNFEEVFEDIVIRDSEMVCVELVATDRHGDFQAVIFIGSIRYEALRNVFDSKQSSLSARMKQSFSWGTQNQKIDTRRTEFIRMRGPHGKGHAEMAISRQKGVPDTPLATPLTTPRATPRATPLTTPDITPCPSPDREKPPPFPDSSSDASCPNNQQNTYHAEKRRYSEITPGSKSSFKWALGGLSKSQSATDQVGLCSNDTGEVEAKSISEELHQHPGTGLFGRSLGQAWHWFKEQRRAASIGLNTRLTYVTLPWHRIIGDVLDKRQSPVLSF